MKVFDPIPYLVFPAAAYAAIFTIVDIFFAHIEWYAGAALGVFLGVWAGLRTLQKHALPVKASFRDYRLAKESINAPRS